MAGGFPLIGVAGVMQTGRRDNQGAIGLQVEPWAWVKFPQWAIEGKIMMRPFAARNHHRGSREWTIGMYEVLQGEIATVAGVDIEHAETGALPGENAHIGIGPLHPPLVNLGRIDAGSVGPVRNARVFAGFLALRVATGTIPLCDVVQWDAVPLPSGIIEGGVHKFLGSWGCRHGRPSCTTGRGLLGPKQRGPGGSH